MDKTIRVLQIKDQAETVATFTMPNVKNVSRNLRDRFSATARFSLIVIDDSAAIAQLFLMPTAHGAHRATARQER